MPYFEVTLTQRRSVRIGVEARDSDQADVRAQMLDHAILFGCEDEPDHVEVGLAREVSEEEFVAIREGA